MYSNCDTNHNVPFHLPASRNEAINTIDGESALGIGIDVRSLASFPNIHIEGNALIVICVPLCTLQDCFTNLADVTPKAARLQPLSCLVQCRFAKVKVVSTGDLGPRRNRSFHANGKVCRAFYHIGDSKDGRVRPQCAGAEFHDLLVRLPFIIWSTPIVIGYQ